MSRFLTAPQHNLGHLVPLRVKNDERESRAANSMQSQPRAQQHHLSTVSETVGATAAVTTDSINSHFAMTVHQTANHASCSCDLILCYELLLLFIIHRTVTLLRACSLIQIYLPLLPNWPTKSDSDVENHEIGVLPQPVQLTLPLC